MEIQPLNTLIISLEAHHHDHMHLQLLKIKQCGAMETMLLDKYLSSSFQPDCIQVPRK